ncbi:MAG: dipeptidase [Chitinophagales bacterium]|nr:dipeptidase [Chitinophagales bacterium]
MSEQLEKNKERYLEELLELLKIPSVSADPEYTQAMIEAASFIESKLRDAGADNVSIFETDGYPIVYGEKLIDASKPTVLVYGHYDVQPPDPIELWESPPFDPVIKDEKIYARGACDDKGQLYMHIKAFEIMMSNNALPCNVKFMFEGEEEVGSEHLEEFVKEHTGMLNSDVVLISDSSMIANDTPSITTGLRGLSYVEVTVTGPNRDLHSGVYGGAVANPVNILCKMIASLHDENGKVTVKGFYDPVADVSQDERSRMAKAPFNLEKYMNELGIDDVHGESGFSTLERTSIRPTLDVNGIWGGYTGEGAKTVLPSKAHAKISMRLVPDQSSKEITELFAKHFKNLAPPYVKVEVRDMHGGEPAVTPTDSVSYKAASRAMETTFGKVPIPLRNGGSIPIVEMFERILKIKTVLMGFGLDSDAIHSPNEHFGLFNYYKGIETIPYFFKYYAEMSED